MIAIKTDMKTMPKGCSECQENSLFGRDEYELVFDSDGAAIDVVYLEGVCCRKGDNIAERGRPEWCPLMEVADEPLQKV